MRVHLTGQIKGALREAPCKNVPAACKEFYQAQRDREAEKSRLSEASRTKTYQEAAEVCRIESESKRKAAEDDTSSKEVNPHTPNFEHVQQVPAARMMV